MKHQKSTPLLERPVSDLCDPVRLSLELYVILLDCFLGNLANLAEFPII